MRRFLYLTWTLAITDFKLKFFGSVLGYMWQLFRPLMLFGVLFVVFTEFLPVGRDVDFYPAVLLTGVVTYLFFAEATGGSVTSVVDRENLVRKIQFPRLAIPMASALLAWFNYMVNFVAVFIFAMAVGVRPSWTWLQVPLILGFLGVFIFGLSLLLSSLYVRFRDVKPMWEVVLQVMWYGSPVIYAIEIVPENLQRIILLNPLAVALQQMRHAFVDPAADGARAAAGGIENLLIPFGIVAVVVVLGLWTFHREAPRIAEAL
jgi:ABC-2 type transport system permease protein